MKKRAQFDLDTECKFLGLPDQEIEAACIYEYMREALSAGQDDSRTTSQPRLPVPFTQRLPFGNHVSLTTTLRKSGFPKPWKKLSDRTRTVLVRAMNGSAAEVVKKLHPAIVIENAVPERDLEREQEEVRRGSVPLPIWRLEPSEPELLRHWEESDRDYFFGFIRIDKSYNETYAVDAFKEWFATQFSKGTHGNPQFLAKLLQLAAMRIRHRYNRGERETILAEATGKAAYKGEQHVADIQLSQDCKNALKFFQSCFPDEQPISAMPRS